GGGDLLGVGKDPRSVARDGGQHTGKPTTPINAEPAEPSEKQLSACSASSALNRGSAGNRTREIRDLLPGVAIVHTPSHPAHPFPDHRILNLQEIRQIGRAHVEALVGGAEEITQLALRE